MIYLQNIKKIKINRDEPSSRRSRCPKTSPFHHTSEATSPDPEASNPQLSHYPIQSHLETAREANSSRSKKEVTPLERDLYSFPYKPKTRGNPLQTSSHSKQIKAESVKDLAIPVTQLLKTTKERRNREKQRFQLFKKQ